MHSSSYWPFYPCHGKKRAVGELHMEQSFACITQQKTKERLSKARCVSLQGKKISRPLRSSHILLLVRITQQGVGCLKHHSFCLWICKISGLGSSRFFFLCGHGVIHHTLDKHLPPSWLIESNAALASVCWEANVMCVYTFLRWENVEFTFAFE